MIRSDSKESLVSGMTRSTSENPDRPQVDNVSGEEKQRVGAVNNSEYGITNSSNICDRQIESFTDEASKVIEAEKIFYTKYLRERIEFVRERIDSSFDKIIIGGESLSELGEIAIAVYYAFHRKPHIYNQMSSYVDSGPFMYREWIIKCGYGSYYYNAMVSMSPFNDLLVKNAEFKYYKETEISRASQLDEGDGVDLEGVGSCIEEAIVRLDKIKEENLYGLFGFVMNPVKTVQDKWEYLLAYFGSGSPLERYQDKYLNPDKGTIVDCAYFLAIANADNHVIGNSYQLFSGYIIRVEILINVLNCLKDKPKTKELLLYVIEIVKDTHDYLHEDRSLYELVRNESGGCGMVDDYYKVRNSLYSILKSFKDLVPREKSADDWDFSPLVRNFNNQRGNRSNKNRRKGKGKGKKAQKRKVTQRRGKKVGPKKQTVKVNTSTGSSLATVSMAPTTTTVTTVSVPIKERKVTEVKVPSVVKKEESSSEESLESIKRETSELLEAFRQYVDASRREKVLKKEEKEKKVVVAESEVKEEKVVEVVKFKNDTLDALFENEKPPHLEIKVSDAINLIKNTVLKGRVEGNGGSKYKIYFGNSTKKAGDFEGSHGKDRRGYLTKEYAENIKDAIKDAVDRGVIPDILAQYKEKDF